MVQFTITSFFASCDEVRQIKALVEQSTLTHPTLPKFEDPISDGGRVFKAPNNPKMANPIVLQEKLDSYVEGK
jgi:hypothetical protein